MTPAPFAVQLLSSLRVVAETTAPVALTALWQGIAMTAALALCLKLTPRMTAAYRFALWFAAFSVLVALPFLPQLSSGAPAASSFLTLPHSNNSSAILNLSMGCSLAIAALWLLASVLRAADLLIHAFRLRKLWRTATPVPSIDASRLRSRRFAICTTPHLDRPSVIGFFAPRILIPDWLFSRLSEGEFRQIVLHEAEHLRRGDDWTNLLQKLCLVLFPLNPALWWIDRRLAKDREMACDEGVIRITKAPRAYAACLASLAERGLMRRSGVAALSLGAWQRRPELAQRVHSLLRRQRNLHPFAARALVTVFSVALLAAAFELASCPQLVAITPAQIPVPTGTLAANLDHAQPPQRIAAALKMPKSTRSSSGYYVMPAVARMPEASAALPTVMHPRPHASEIRAVPAIAKADLPQQQRIVRTSTVQTTDPATGAQWIVYTEFEQIENVGARAPLTADYETPQTGDAPQTQKSATPSQPVTHTTVTRLIFRVAPTTSQNAQPTAIPIGNGWFVFQL